VPAIPVASGVPGVSDSVGLIEWAKGTARLIQVEYLEYKLYSGIVKTWVADRLSYPWIGSGFLEPFSLQYRRK